jgi:hypothetical protein
VPFKKEKSSDETKEVPKMISVFNCLCDLITFEINPELDPEGTVAVEWEYTRTEIANTLTAIANQEASDLIDKEPTEEDKIIHGA